MPETPRITVDSPSVQSYLSILQAIINRMAGNSASCKTWCITIVSAIVVVLADKGRPEFVRIAWVPVLLFLLLDAYYLSLEKHFRDSYNRFIGRLHGGEVSIDDIFLVSGPAKARHTLLGTLRSSLSVSVWPFYGLLAGMLIVVRVWVLRS